MVEVIKKVNRPVVIMGDFNCSLTSDENTLNIFQDSLSISTWPPKDPTFPSHKATMCLDHVFVRQHLKMSHYTAMPIVLSDNQSVLAEVFIQK